MSVIDSVAWKKLTLHCASGAGVVKMVDLMKDKNRSAKLALSMPGLYVDFSKNRVTAETLELLLGLAKEQDVTGWIEKLFSGDKVNDTENRPALHTLLRKNISQKNANKIEKSIETQFKKMAKMVTKIRQGHWRGASGKSITDVVNIGVGGSDLGPLMVTHALQATASSINLHFISSIDGTQSTNIFKQLNPETTLFILASKSFSTIDTLANAETAIHWLEKKIANRELILNQHFIGVSANPEKMLNWGIPTKNQLLFWDWVGGRYSMWSTIGLPIALKMGMDGFKEFLAGAREMDEHFQQQPLAQNIPVILALIDVWNVNFLAIQQKSILPYDARLKYLPAYLTQLVMESNGKSVDRQGNKVGYKTCPILWGEVGTNAQHAFYQLLHQGTQKVMCDFIAVIKRDDFNHSAEAALEQSLKKQHELALANCLAQSRVLMLGDDAIPKNLQSLFDSPFKHYPGNQPSNTILLDAVSANSIGKLVALYEHKTFVESVIWNINPFDQWGVELGKMIAVDTHKALQGSEKFDFDPSTENLLTRLKQPSGSKYES